MDYSNVINLYNSEEEVVACLYELNPTGYVIACPNTREVIEYSQEDHGFIINNSEHYYYGGPLSYFKRVKIEESFVAVDLKTGEQIMISEIPNIEKGVNIEGITLDNFLITPRANSVDSLDYGTVAYEYMPINGCGATASGIMLKYYDTHISGSYIPSSLESSNGKLVIDAIYNRMSSPTDGSTYAELRNALNIYLKQYYKAQSVVSVTSGWASRIKTQISANKPCILGLTSHPTYKEHWVVVTGYNLNASNSGTYTVNDGWGHTGIQVNSSYTDGCIYF